MKTLAENVRTARHFNGWTQEQLAQRAGVSQTTIDKIEQGKILRSRFLAHIALALDVPAEALDPTLARAKEDWNKVLKEKPQNFYTMKPVAELPMFGMEKTEEFGVFRLTEKPLYEVPSPRILDGRPAFSVYVQNDLMAPEIGDGDAAFFDERLTLFCGCTGIFMKVERLRSLCVIARLLEISDENFTVAFWKDNYVTRLPIEEWPIARPMVVKYVRNPSEDEG